MNILGLDLGTHTGVCYNQADRKYQLTRHWITAKEVTENHRTRMDRRCDPRIVRFYEWLLSCRGIFDAVVFEDVQFSKFTQQTQLWSSFRTAVWLAFGEDPRKPVIECVPTNVLKQYAGSGSADKDKMRALLQRSYPAMLKADMDDNAVDATWLWLWGQQVLGRYKKNT